MTGYNIAATEDDVGVLKLRCAVFSNILWWKTLFLRAALLLSIVCVFLTMFLLLYVRFR